MKQTWFVDSVIQASTKFIFDMATNDKKKQQPIVIVKWKIKRQSHCQSAVNFFFCIANEMETRIITTWIFTEESSESKWSDLPYCLDDWERKRGNEAMNREL